jgi:hypothetical protein
VFIGIPIRSKIGKIPFTFQEVGNSHAYQYVQSGKTYWGVTNGFTDFISPSFGLRAHDTASSYTCKGTAETIYSNFFVTDGTGASHPLPAATVDHLGCFASSATLVTTDGTGYTVVVGSSGTLVTTPVHDP